MLTACRAPAATPRRARRRCSPRRRRFPAPRARRRAPPRAAGAAGRGSARPGLRAVCAPEHAHADAVLGEARGDLAGLLGDEAAVVHADVLLESVPGSQRSATASQAASRCSARRARAAHSTLPIAASATVTSRPEIGHVSRRPSRRSRRSRSRHQAIPTRVAAMPQNFDGRAQHDEVVGVRADDGRGARIGDEVDVGLVDDERRVRVAARCGDELGGGQRDAAGVVRVGDDHEVGGGERGVDLLDRGDGPAGEAAAGERLEVVGVGGQRDGDSIVADLPAQRPDELRRAAPGDDLRGADAEVAGVEGFHPLGGGVGMDLQVGRADRRAQRARARPAAGRRSSRTCSGRCARCRPSVAGRRPGRRSHRRSASRSSPWSGLSRSPSRRARAPSSPHGGNAFTPRSHGGAQPQRAAALGREAVDDALAAAQRRAACGR